MTNHEHFMENVRGSEFAARHARIEAMSPTEQAEERRREVAASERITRPVWRTRTHNGAPTGVRGTQFGRLNDDADRYLD